MFDITITDAATCPDRALERLIDRATRAGGHTPLGEHKYLRIQRADDLGRSLAAWDGERLLGYAHALAYEPDSRTRVSCELVVDPDARHDGVGRMLLSAVLDHACADSADSMDIWAYNDSGDIALIAEEFGFVPARRLLHLHRHMETLPAVERPAGTTTRAFRPGIDDDAWLALNRRIFAEHPENGSWSGVDLEARFAQPWFRADDFRLLEADGKLAGFCWLKIAERGDDGHVGEIYVIGVAPEYRGRGYARHLLAEGLARIRARNAPVAAIYVDSANEAALRLYDAAGFHYHHVDVCYSRELSARTADVERAVAAA